MANATTVGSIGWFGTASVRVFAVATLGWFTGQESYTILDFTGLGDRYSVAGLGDRYSVAGLGDR